MHPYLNTAIEAAKSARAIIAHSMEMFNHIEIYNKGAPNDFVSSVDKALEAEIIKIIKKSYPDHGILSEEIGEISGTNPHNVIWIIDPLDGTFNFIHGFPQFCVSIGVQVKGIMEHAVVYNPISNELFSATKGAGVRLNGRRIVVSDCNILDRALIGTNFSYKRTEKTNQSSIRLLTNILEKADIRITGSSALDLAFVAAGRLDGFYEDSLGPWDLAAGSLLVHEAGGFIGDFNGGDQFLNSGSVIAATPKIFNELLNIINFESSDNKQFNIKVN